MQDLIQKWKEFRKWWAVNGGTIAQGEFEGKVWRPQFDDFMDWLVEDEKTKI